MYTHISNLNIYNIYRYFKSFDHVCELHSICKLLSNCVSGWVFSISCCNNDQIVKDSSYSHYLPNQRTLIKLKSP